MRRFRRVIFSAPFVFALSGCAGSTIHTSAYNGSKNRVQTFLDHGVPVDQPNSNVDGETPLMFAAAGGSPDTVELLLARGADPAAHSLHGNSVLDSAQRGGNAEVIRLLNEALIRKLNPTQAPADKQYAFVAPSIPLATAFTPLPPASAIISDVDTPTEHAAPHEDDFALVIGIEDYESVPKADYGVRDASTVRKHLEAMGWPARNIISLEGRAATGSKLKSYLEEWLPLNVKPNSTLLVYYSGHGAPDPMKGDAYIVPWDGDPRFLKSTAYPLKHLYSELSNLKAKRVLIVLDACFSGAGGRSVLAKGARPLVATVAEAFPTSDNLTVLAAAGSDEITGTLDDQEHGVFTYYLLKGLSGAAKDARGNVTVKGLFDYLKPRVEDAGRRQNRIQVPTFNGSTAGDPLATY